MLDARRMPGARWFEGVELNYAEQVLRRAPAHGARDRVARRGRRRVGAVGRRSCAGRSARWRRRCASWAWGPATASPPTCRTSPRRWSAMLATASIGAVWTACAPDFGAQSVIDRFGQVEPKVLLAVDGYRSAGATTTAARSSPSCRRRCRRCARRSLVRSAFGAGRRRSPPRARRRASREFARVPFDAPAVDPLLVGHHRAAEGHRPLRTAASCSSTSSRSGCAWTSARRPLLLPQLDELDGVELPRRRAAARRDDRPVRRVSPPRTTSTGCSAWPSGRARPCSAWARRTSAPARRRGRSRAACGRSARCAP